MVDFNKYYNECNVWNIINIFHKFVVLLESLQKISNLFYMNESICHH